MDEIETLKRENEEMWDVVVLIVGAVEQQHVVIKTHVLVPERVRDIAFDLYNARLERRAEKC